MRSIIFMLLILSSITGILEGQTSIDFFEDFSDFSDNWDDNDDWTIYDEDGLNDELWTNSIWRISTSWDVAMCSSTFNPPGQADDWLILPKIPVPTTNSPYLRWVASSYASNNNSGNERSDYEVLISTTTNEISSFELLETILVESKTETNHFINLSDYKGMEVYLAFRHISDDQYILRIHELEIGTTTQFDARLLVTSFKDEYILPDEAISNISLEVTNTGFDMFTGFTVKWDLDNGNSTGERVYTNSMPDNGSQVNGINFNTASTAPNSEDIGIHELKIWIELPSSTPDQNSLNDTIHLKFYTIEQSGQKRVMLDESTGTWCGPCADGVVRINEIEDLYGDSFIPIAFHIGDVMSTEKGDTIPDNYFSGSPQATIDRFQFESGGPVGFSRGDWKNRVGERKNHLTPFDIEISNNYDSSTREIEAKINVLSYGIVDKDFNVGLYIVEDNVTGNEKYDQRNSSNTTAGHPFEGFGDPIPNFIHKHVFRDAIGSIWGMPNFVYSPTLAGVHYEKTFTYTLPEYYDEEEGNEVLWENIQLVAFVAQRSDIIEEKTVLNVTSAKLEPLMTSELNMDIDLNKIELYPNPSNGNIQYSNYMGGEIVIHIINSYGQVVKSIATSEYSGAFTIDQSGLYIVNVTRGNNAIVSKKILILNK